MLNIKKIQEKGEDILLDYKEHMAWMDLLNLNPGAKMSDLAVRQIEGGDAVMQRLWERVAGDGGRIDEQIDKFNGNQASAASLTWSYANILHALKVRENALKLKESVLN